MVGIILVRIEVFIMRMRFANTYWVNLRRRIDSVLLNFKLTFKERQVLGAALNDHIHYCFSEKLEDSEILLGIQSIVVSFNFQMLGLNEKSVLINRVETAVQTYRGENPSGKVLKFPTNPPRGTGPN